MRQQVGSLYTTLTLESSSFITATKRAATATEQMAAQVNRGFNTARAGAIGFLGALTVGQLVGFTRSALDAAGGLGELAAQAGVSTRTFQQYSFIATQAGVSQEQLESGLARLTRTLGEAREGGRQQVEAFKAVGVSYEQLRRSTPDQVLRLVADGLAKIQDPAIRAAREIDLFGKAGQQLDPLLSGGTTAIDEMAVEAEKLGVVLSEEQIANADKTADKIAALQRALGISIASTVSENAVAIGTFAESVAATIAQAIRLANFLASNPAVTGGAAGAAFGARVGGLPGAAIGGAIGAASGSLSRQPSSADLIAQLKSSDAQLIPFGKEARRKRLSVQIQAALDREAAQARTGASRTTPVITAPELPDFNPRFNVGSFRGGRGGGGGSAAAAPAANDIYQGFSAADVRAGALDSLGDVLGEDSVVSQGLQGLIDKSIDLDATLGEAFGATNLEGLALEIPKISAGLVELEEGAVRFGDQLADSLANAIVYSGDLGQALLGTIRQASAELLSSALSSLFRSGINAIIGGGSGGGGFLSGLFGGGKAAGGEVFPGRVYDVGENGRERVIFNAPGRIIPNHMLEGANDRGGMGRMMPAPTFNLYGVTDERTARRTGKQAAAAWQQEMTKYRRQGIAA